MSDAYINKREVIIIGDFNINLADKSSVMRKKILDISQAAGFKQIITKCTHITKTSKSLIDHIYTNNYSLIELPNEYTQLSDHKIVGVELRTTKIYNTAVFKMNRNLSQNNIKEIINHLIDKIWNYMSVDVDVLYNGFINNIKETLDIIAPLTKMQIKRNP